MAANSFKEWIKERHSRSMVKISSLQELQKYKHNNDVFVALIEDDEDG